MNNCRNASVSAADRILVSSSDEQLFIEVWLVRDDEFKRDLDRNVRELMLWLMDHRQDGDAVNDEGGHDRVIR